MFFELVGTVAGGLAAAGMIMFFNKILRGLLPKWTIPVGSGAVMIGMSIWNDYSWYSRTYAALPPEMYVITEVESKSFYQPWTYVFPYVQRFAALDRASVMTNDQVPDIHIATVTFMDRWVPTRQVKMFVDCARRRRVDIIEGLEFSDVGIPVENTPWIVVESDHPILRSVCITSKEIKIR